MARKTIDVKAVVGIANLALAAVNSDDTGGVDRRWGVIGMVEAVLFHASNYHGFRYLETEYAGDGEPTDRPGSVLRQGYDQTRRAYFTD